MDNLVASLNRKLDAKVNTLNTQHTKERARLDGLEKHQHDQFANIETEQGRLSSRLSEVQEIIQDDRGKALGRFEVLGPAMQSLAKKVDARLQEQDEMIASSNNTDEVRYARLAQHVETHTKDLALQVRKISMALSAFKKAVASLGGNLVKQEGRVSDIERRMIADKEVFKSHIEKDAQARLKGVTQKVNAEGQATEAHLAEVTRSIASVAQAMKDMETTLMGKMALQDQRLTTTTDTLRAVTTEVNSLTQGVDQRVQTRQQQEGITGAGALGEKATDSFTARPATPVRQAEAIGTVRAGTSKTFEEQARHRYERILAIFQRGALEEARQGFLEFLMTYPRSNRAPNAQYWLGECFYGKKQYQEAIQAYDRVEAQYPRSEKVPAALLKKGYAYLALNDHRQARTVLQRVVDSYPKSPEAQKALGRLTTIRPLP